MSSLNEPTWTTATPTWTEDSALASMPLRGSIISGLLLRLIESHYASADNIVDPALKSYIWQENLPNAAAITSKVLIKLAEEYTPRDLEMKPTILVKRNEVTSKKISIGGKAITHLEPNGNYKGEHYVRLITGSHLILCIADGGLATDRLAEETFFRLVHYTPSIKEDLKFTEFECTGYTPSEPFKETGERAFVVRLGISWAHVEDWTLLPIAPVLKKVRTTAPGIF